MRYHHQTMFSYYQCCDSPVQLEDFLSTGKLNQSLPILMTSTPFLETSPFRMGKWVNIGPVLKLIHNKYHMKSLCEATQLFLERSHNCYHHHRRWTGGAFGDLHSEFAACDWWCSTRKSDLSDCKYSIKWLATRTIWISETRGETKTSLLASISNLKLTVIVLFSVE